MKVLQSKREVCFREKDTTSLLQPQLENPGVCVGVCVCAGIHAEF